jgi:acetylornithine deacetylase/succinyl-diaminopimelate desuccinylase-like protein
MDFFNMLAGWVARDTGTPGEDKDPRLFSFFENQIITCLKAMDFDCRIVENPDPAGGPFLLAKRAEDPGLPSVLIYGHADTVPPMAASWEAGLSPLELTRKGEKWYGRGTADNKGQLAVNLAALDCVIKERGKLGFNVTVLLESGEESGSPGLHEICRKEKEFLKSDVLIASDGPRIDPDVPTIFGGSRAVFNFDMGVCLREGQHHSGNWGGLLANPGIILAHAIASLVDAKGRILVEALRPQPVPAGIQKAIEKLTVTGKGGPEIDPSWGEPGLSAAAKVYGWNTLEVLAFQCGDPAQPANAIPPKAWARCHIRFIADSDPKTFIPAIQNHLDERGFSSVTLDPVPNSYGLATRMDPGNPWVRFVTRSFETTSGKPVTFLPNLGGTLPNDAFSAVIGMPTIWVPHSYGGCNQHAPNEHVLDSIMREGLLLMTGLFWDIPESNNLISRGE